MTHSFEAMLMRTLLVSLCSSLLFAGCVSSGKYDDLKVRYDKAQARISENGLEIHTLGQTVSDRERRAQDLERMVGITAAQLAQKQTELMQLEQRVKEVESQLAVQTGESARLRFLLADLVKDRSRLKESTEQLNQALLELSQRKAEADRRVAEVRTLLAQFKTMIDAGQLSVKIVDGRMVLALPSDVIFDSGSAKLSTVGTQTVQSVATVLAAMSGKSFQVEGHTDNVPINTARFPTNWELASARALVVVKTMLASGMQQRALSAASYGEFHPAAGNDTEQGRASNRRIEVVLVPDLSSLPGAAELQRAVSGH